MSFNSHDAALSSLTEQLQNEHMLINLAQMCRIIWDVLAQDAYGDVRLNQQLMSIITNIPTSSGTPGCHVHGQS